MKGRDQIEALQLAGLRRLIGALRAGNAFYGPLLEKAGLEQSVSGLERFAALMPFTTKMDLVRDREEHPPFGSNLTEPVENYNRYHQSSGITSGPLAFVDTEESWGVQLDCWERVYDAAGISAAQRIYFAFSFGPFLGFWSAFEAATRRGNLSIPGGGASSSARLEAIAVNGVTVLCCTPTYALRLGEVRQASGESSPVTKIIVAGEPGGSIPAMRAAIEAAWEGARVYDHHGMTEVGPVSYEHPEFPMELCIIEDAYFAEVIDLKSLEEVETGETGELVLTTLGRVACPLLRYRTGDLVRKSYRPEAGEGGGEVFTLEGGILGRTDDMVVIRGVNIYPSAIEKIVRAVAEVAEFQVIETTVDSMAELEIVIETVSGVADREAIAAAVERALGDAFALRIPVHLAAEDSLPRYEFKSKRWVKK
ncbi:MAG: phenylacetate--CoA ligase family protein [Verrucomicrobiales bacterium]